MLNKIYLVQVLILFILTVSISSVSGENQNFYDYNIDSDLAIATCTFIDTQNDDFYNSLLEIQLGSTIDLEGPEVKITKPAPGVYWRDIKIWPKLSFTLFPLTETYIFRFITIEASASDNLSGIDRVEFYVQGVLKSIDNTAPYNWLWHETSFFKHTIEARAYDKAGNMESDSKEVNIFNINPFPQINN
jgi:hypothetical protein